MSEQAIKALQIEYDIDMDRFYIPVNSRYEIQTKGKGSSFRIANTATHIRNLIADEHLHEMLEDMARGTNAELLQAMAATAEANKRIEALESEVAELKDENHNLNWALGTDGYEQMATPEQQIEYTEGLKKIEARIADMKHRKEVITELQADNNRLREALDYLDNAFDNECWNCPRCGHGEETNTMDSAIYLKEFLNRLPATPVESLAKRDDEVIEKCARVCEQMALLGGLDFAEAIRALKGK